MPSLSLHAEADGSARITDRWTVPRAAAFVTLLSGGLWLAIVAIASWLIA
jgi:hypothetical protein